MNFKCTHRNIGDRENEQFTRLWNTLRITVINTFSENAVAPSCGHHTLTKVILLLHTDSGFRKVVIVLMYRSELTVTVTRPPKGLRGPRVIIFMGAPPSMNDKYPTLYICFSVNVELKFQIRYYESKDKFVNF